MIAGSFASTFHGIARATQDLDLVVAPTSAALETFLASLSPDVYYVDADTDLDLAARMRTTIMLVAHARAHALDLERERHAYQDSGMTVDEWFIAHASALHRITGRGGLRLLAEAAAAPDLALDPDTLFAFGLERLLDGVAVLIQRAARPRSSRSTNAENVYFFASTR